MSNTWSDSIGQTMDDAFWYGDGGVPPAVRLVRKLVEVDLRLAVWAVLQSRVYIHAAAESVFRRDTRPALISFVFSDDAHDRLYWIRPWVENAAHLIHTRGSYPVLLRQVRPMRVRYSGRIVQRASSALQVAWDATVGGHSDRRHWRHYRWDTVRNEADAQYGWLRRAFERLPRLTAWLQAREPECKWKPSSVWQDPVGRMLCERSTLEVLP